MVVLHDKKRVELWFEDLKPSYIKRYLGGELSMSNLIYDYFSTAVKDRAKYWIDVRSYHVVFWDDDKTRLLVFNKSYGWSAEAHKFLKQMKEDKLKKIKNRKQ